jgi:hypothetical protein
MRRGEGTRSPEEAIAAPVDTDMLRKIMANVEKGLPAWGADLNPAKKAHLIGLLYDHFTATPRNEVRKDVVESYLDLVV